MYYLKCNHCGHANALRTEYVTFCESCGKKMTNNYSDWKQRHPDKSFETYAQMIGIQAPVVEARAKAVKRPRSGGSRWIVWLVAGIVLVGVAGGLIAGNFMKGFLNKGVPKSWLSKEWHTFNVDRGIAEIQTPVDLQPYRLGIPVEVMKYVELMRTCRVDTTLPMQISLHEFQYKPAVEVSLQGAAMGSVNEMRAQPSVSDLDYKQEAVNISGNPGFLQKGRYTFRGQMKLKFQNLGFLKDKRLVQIVVIYPEQDETGQKVADRVISSVKLRDI